MKNVIAAVLIVFCICAMLDSCKKENGSFTEKNQSISLPSEGSAVVTANNEFAFNFLQSTLSTDTVADNKLISPLSVYLALSMVYNGAGTATADSMAKVLQLSGIDLGSLNSVCQSLVSQFPKEDNAVQLSIANSIWYAQNTYQPYDSFLHTTQTDYDATVQSINFKDPGSVNTINNWVAQKTNNKIPSVISSIDPSDLMFLINAIYFNGSWKYAFNTADTYNDIFHLGNGTSEKVPFMKQMIKLNLSYDSSFTLLELPYGSGKSYSMYIALPADTLQPISSFAAMMNADLLSKAISNMDSAGVDLEIPKWSCSYAIMNMSPELSALGMGVAFTDAADFSKIYDPSQVQVYISKAIHKTFINVSESGTQAAAATVIGIAYLTSNPSAPPVIKFNHPFLYSIIEKQTGTVMFMGIVNDPAKN
jgi:serine protease inhibitor